MEDEELKIIFVSHRPEDQVWAESASRVYTYYYNRMLEETIQRIDQIVHPPSAGN